jgi:NADH-dependent peroxiredoxin subunit F
MTDIEIYTRLWCPYCIKAKALLQTKGLEWREFDITRAPELQHEMQERSGRHTVPQIFIDGDPIGGYDDLAHLNASGELDRRLGREPAELKTIYDVAVIGGGPAGLTAAMYAGRKNLSTVLLATDLGGQLGTTRDVANYPGCELILGPDLVQRLYAQAKLYGVTELIGERVAGIRVAAQTATVDLASGREICARAVIIASGAQKRRLGIPGEKELAGTGVFYCATCDGPLFRDADVVVVGGGNSAMQAALELAPVARGVTVVAMEGLTGDAVLRDKVTAAARVRIMPHHKPTEIHGASRAEGVTVVDVETGAAERVAADGVFVEIGYLPNTSFALDLVDTNEAGEIIVDRRCRTGVRGVFAAGDCTDVHDKQVVISVGEGAKAALSAFEYLISQA